MFLESKTPRMVEKLERGEPLIGVMLISDSPQLIETLAYVGYDYVFVDQMFSTVDWRSLGEMVRWARGSDMAVLARIENDPWFGDDGSGTSARVARAMALGCDGAKVSVFSARQAEAVVNAGGGWHRGRVQTFKPDLSEKFSEEFRAEEAAREKTALMVPSVESKLGIEQTSEILRISGLRMFGIAMTDTTRMLGVPFQYDHPKVWQYVDKTVEEAKSLGVDICAGTGYSFSTWDAIAERTLKLRQHGINMIFLQTAEWLFQRATTDLLKRVRGALGY